MEIVKKILKIENKRWALTSFIFGLFILLPILVIFLKIFSTKGASFYYLWDTLLLEYSLNTIYLVIIVSVFSLIFGIFPAWFISLYKFPGRKFYDIVLFLPLAIPSYIMAFTYSDILSYTGPVLSLMREYTPEIYLIFNKDYLQIEILGIILGLALYPYIYSVSRVSFSLIGSNYINVSKNLGLSSFKTFYKIILPLSTPAILSGLFLVIMEVLNEYGAVKYFGVNTYTTGIFRAWFSMGDITTAIQLAGVLILLVFILLFLEKNLLSKSKYNYTSNSKIQNLISL
ncbi:MAG: iron(III) transport system permease protein, partial [Flavobacteriaceae bacterium]